MNKVGKLGSRVKKSCLKFLVIKLESWYVAENKYDDVEMSQKENLGSKCVLS